MDKLLEIIDHKKREIEKLIPLEDKLRVAAASRNDFRSLRTALDLNRVRLSLIAEVKKASPSAGTIAPDFDPVRQAIAYAKAGVDAISVLTDEKYFQGNLAYLNQIRAAVPQPLLRKDFMVHPVQIYESVIAGADAILLIVAALSQDELVSMLDLAKTYQLDVLVEVHDESELDRALATEADIIGVNNRNLKTFEVDLHTTERLSSGVDDDIIFVSESGIRNKEDARQMFEWGADAILVGETLMRSHDVSAQVRQLTGVEFAENMLP